jgi:predicted ribosome quality control (RQC) complex YloA/Tae2 family protein
MAFDGITVASIVSEIKDNFINGRITKITQPEKDALVITLKNTKEQRMLLMSASASLPLIYFTENKKNNPITAPAFLMLLRKHIGNARIIDVTQPEFERIIDFKLEHLNEMGDLCVKHLIIELMGKYSNIIFTDDNNIILDAIKHVPSSVSSVREVLPGRTYFIPNTMDKINPLTVTDDSFKEILKKPSSVVKALSSSFTGVSNVAAIEILIRASVDPDRITDSLTDIERIHIINTFNNYFDDVKNSAFTPYVYYEGNKPVEYTCFDYVSLKDRNKRMYESISKELEDFYLEKEKYLRNRQKSSELRALATQVLERNVKKLDLQLKQLNDTESRDKYKIYGELLHTYGYNIEPGSKEFTCLNYYTNEDITIPLDNTKTAMENAQKYFDRYGKLKRTKEALDVQIVETKTDIDYLESVLSCLDMAETEDDLKAIKDELSAEGYIKKHVKGKKEKYKSAPLHFVTSEGFDIYIGKNNTQNDELTFKFAGNNDYWFHAKKIPGSHVILRANGKELTDKSYTEAAAAAAYYSKARDTDKVEVDYLIKSKVKKPNGAKPGFVVYYTNYSMAITPSVESLTLVKD